jgi:hypothetical protein
MLAIVSPRNTSSETIRAAAPVGAVGLDCPGEAPPDCGIGAGVVEIIRLPSGRTLALLAAKSKRGPSVSPRNTRTALLVQTLSSFTNSVYAPREFRAARLVHHRVVHAAEH